MFTIAELNELTNLGSRMSKSDKLENVLQLVHPVLMEHELQIEACLKLNKGHEIGLCYLPGIMIESFRKPLFLRYQTEKVKITETTIHNLKQNYMDCIQIITKRPVNLKDTIRLVKNLLMESLNNIEYSLQLNKTHETGLSHLSGLLEDTIDKPIYLQTLMEKTKAVENSMIIMQGISVNCLQLLEASDQL
jgi:hypothetical protein